MSPLCTTVSEPLFTYGDQAWADPVIAGLLERSEDETLMNLTAASPSFGTLILSKTGGRFYDSLHGQRLVWLLKNREADCVPVTEIVCLKRYYSQDTCTKLMDSVVPFLAGHPLVQPSLRRLPTYLLDSSQLGASVDRTALYAAIGSFPKVQDVGLIEPSSTEAAPVELAPILPLGLTRLDFTRFAPTDAVLGLFSGQTSLRELRLSIRDLKAVLTATLPHLTSLTSLELNLRDAPPSSLSSLSKLTALKQARLDGLNAEGKLGVTAFLPHLSQLTRLHMYGGNEPFFSWLGPHVPESVQSLSIPRCAFSDADLPLFSRLTRLASLEYIECSFEDCTPEGFQKLRLDALETLRISNGFPPSSFAFLRTLPNLKHLRGYFEGTEFDLAHCPPSLRTFSLECKVSSLGPLSSLTALRSLTINPTETLQSSELHHLSALESLRGLNLYTDDRLTKEIVEKPSDLSRALAPLTKLTGLLLSDSYSRETTLTLDYFPLVAHLSRLRRLHLGPGVQTGLPSSWEALPTRFPELVTFKVRLEGEEVPLFVKQALARLPMLRTIAIELAKKDPETGNLNYDPKNTIRGRKYLELEG